MKIKLDKYERDIERSANAYHPVLRKERDKIEGVLDRMRKTRNINIRLSESVLEQLKRRSLEEGVPYQTLISSVLHKFVTDRLVDEAAIRKSIRMLHSNQ
jgi:predicted DNA binding CopG/RHH family protein